MNTHQEDCFSGQYTEIPKRMQDAMLRYVDHGVNTGSFLGAVIENNLRDAVGYADSENLPLLHLYVLWFYNVAPAGCCGGAKQRAAWLQDKQSSTVSNSR